MHGTQFLVLDWEKICRLLVGTILLDTVNLDPEHKKVTPKDEEAVRHVAQIAQYTPAFLVDLAVVVTGC